MESVKANDLTIYPISENAVTIEFGNAIDESLMANINGFNKMLRKKPFPGMHDTVLAYATLSVFFDPIQLIRQNNIPGKTCYEKVCNYLQRLEYAYDPAISGEGALIEIPVCYGGKSGPDIEYVAGTHQLSIDEVIQLHSSAIYKVYMIGFIPGFAYMGGLDGRLETPRKAYPQRVPAGAVGIAGEQTGIYPLETPGGWQIIGRTPAKMFDAARPNPSLLKAGDRVKFEAISFSAFKKYGRG